MKKILFDESHKELLDSQCAEDDIETDKWEKLRSLLEAQDWEVGILREEDSPLTIETLEGCDLLVLGAPGKPLLPGEIKVVQQFVTQGHALLVANSMESLWRQNSNSMQVLLEPYGIRFEQSLYKPSQEVRSFYPHYISSNIVCLSVREPTYLELPTQKAYIVATLSNPEKPFLVTVDHLTGRIVVIGDFVVFGDRYIEKSDNSHLSLNIFRWLLFENSLDCRDAQVDSRIFFGETATFSVVLINQRPQRAEKIRCLLESDSGAQIESPALRIRSIPPGGQTWLQWVIEPQRLGRQALRLTVDYPRSQNQQALFFDPVAQFDCLPNADIGLAFIDSTAQETESVATEASFEARAVVNWASDAREVSLKWDLQFSLDHFSPIETDPDGGKWRLLPLLPGDWPITLKEVKTGHIIERLLRVRPSKAIEIQRIEQQVVAPLAAQIHVLLAQLRPNEFDTESIRRIPFRILTPEDYVKIVYPADAARRLLMALETLRTEQRKNSDLLDKLLGYIAPSYSPTTGCCIPYDPALVTLLTHKYPLYEESLSTNFLSSQTKDALWLEQNVAAFLLHEKYGHGFFYTQTALGRQLAILYRHGLLSEEDRQRAPAPYPRMLGVEYADALQALDDSSIIVNEGFAAWVELAFLPKLPPAVGQSVHLRASFLLESDKELEKLKENSLYFQRFPPFMLSRYREGYEYFRLIHGYFGDLYGPKCAVQAMLKASDVNVGIAENNGLVTFGLSEALLRQAVLDPSVTDDARADMRLRRIHIVLRDHHKEIFEKQRKLQCYQVCLHDSCPVNQVIQNQLKW